MTAAFYTRSYGSSLEIKKQPQEAGTSETESMLQILIKEA